MVKIQDIKIESVTIKDAERLSEIYAPYVKNTAISFEYDPPSGDEFCERIKNISAGYPYLKAVLSGKTVGYAYAATFKPRSAYERCVESTIYLDMNYRGQGIGRCLYSALQEELKSCGILNMNACIACPLEDIHGDNGLKSQNGYMSDENDYVSYDSFDFHRAMGFSLVGRFHKCGYKFGKWFDMVWMEKLIGEHL